MSTFDTRLSSLGLGNSLASFYGSFLLFVPGEYFAVPLATATAAATAAALP
jgi:hypothetical protein